MKGILKDKHVQIRFSEAELVKYKSVAFDNGFTMSGFARYAMAKAARIIKHNQDEETL